MCLMGLGLGQNPLRGLYDACCYGGAHRFASRRVWCVCYRLFILPHTDATGFPRFCDTTEPCPRPAISREAMRCPAVVVGLPYLLPSTHECGGGPGVVRHRPQYFYLFYLYFFYFLFFSKGLQVAYSPLICPLPCDAVDVFFLNFSAPYRTSAE